MANTIQFGSLYLGKTPEIAQCVYPCHRPAISVGDMVEGKEVRWVLVDGLLVASYPILHEVSWEDLEEQGLVEGREVVIDGSRYRCRLLCTYGNSRTQLDEWELSKKTIYPELQVLTMDREDGCFWVLGPFGPELKLGCKKEGRDEYSWRPVLDPISLDFSRLKEGDYVQLGCGSNLISGFLEEATDYDLILDKNFSQISEVYLGDIEDFARKEKNGRWAVDKSAISVARTNNARGEEIIWLSAI